MATGRLGAEDLSAETNTTVYTCPSEIYSVVSVNICNRGSDATSIRIAAASSDTPTDAEYIEYDFSISSKQVLERTGIVLSEGQKIVVYSSLDSVSVVVFGIETPA